MNQIFRIHGDNIVECERIASLILSEIGTDNYSKTLLSPSTIALDTSFTYYGHDYTWHIELLPGFNKSGRTRWAGNIFDSLKKRGSFLDETPDAIVTEVVDAQEQILYAIEFCSALQAGNQAWQRSGRAFSTGRTGCPYIYIVDFVKYELDPVTREPKALRFPNAAVPYSYINFSRVNDSFVAQVYVKSESFNKESDPVLANFDESYFAELELKKYLVKKMAHIDTLREENTIIQKNFSVVCFLANLTNSNKNFSSEEWIELHDSGKDVIDYCVTNQRFNFRKKITQKGMHGHLKEVLDIVDTYSAGFTSKDLPIGIIPADKRPAFSKALHKIYPSFNNDTIESIADPTANLVLCLFKGFKPRGDDNRPDRGLLPLAAMLSDTDNEILTIIYGPILFKNYQLLLNDVNILVQNNGLWKSIISLSDYVLLDAPILRSKKINEVEELLFTAPFKQQSMHLVRYAPQITSMAFSNLPQEYHEDDVDTGIHYLFTEILEKVCFEGMCNPPGGDWSGLSILDHDYEKRWLSLPRVSDSIDGKRPDHVLEIFEFDKKPVLLSIESKERSSDLEPNVGQRLVAYIEHLMHFAPNAERNISDGSGWIPGSTKIKASDFIFVSAAAYLKDTAQGNDIVHESSNCDMLFIMTPLRTGWKIEIVSYTPVAKRLKNYIVKLVAMSTINTIDII